MIVGVLVLCSSSLAYARSPKPLVPEIPVAAKAETLVFTKTGESKTTTNGITVTLRHGGHLERGGNLSNPAEAGLQFEIDGHPPVVTSGFGHHYVFGRPVTVGRLRAPDRKGLYGRTNLSVTLGPSAPRFTEDLDAQVAHVLAKASLKGYQPKGYTWTTTPSNAGVLVMRMKLDTGAVVEAMLNQTTGEVEFTELGAKHRTFGNPVGDPKLHVVKPVPLATVMLATSNPTILLREAIFSDCVRVPRNTKYRVSSNAKGKVEVRHLSGHRLFENDEKCLERTAAVIESKKPFSFEMEAKITSKNWFPRSSRPLVVAVTSKHDNRRSIEAALDVQRPLFENCVGGLFLDPPKEPVVLTFEAQGFAGKRVNNSSTKETKTPTVSCFTYILEREVALPPAAGKVTIEISF